jgi:hypothetical protein
MGDIVLIVLAITFKFLYHVVSKYCKLYYIFLNTMTGDCRAREGVGGGRVSTREKGH